MFKLSPSQDATASCPRSSPVTRASFAPSPRKNVGAWLISQKVFCLDGRSISLSGKNAGPIDAWFPNRVFGHWSKVESRNPAACCRMRITAGVRPRSVIGQLVARSAVSQFDGPFQLPRHSLPTARDLLSACLDSLIDFPSCSPSQFTTATAVSVTSQPGFHEPEITWTPKVDRGSRSMLFL